MKFSPVEYESEMHYPLLNEACSGCRYEHASISCSKFTYFIKLEPGMKSSCGKRDMPSQYPDVIWQTGEKAHLQYITQRLTS